MSDQADQLRALVRQRAAAALAAEPALLVVSGACRGVGCTTVAIELALALEELNSRTVFVDADVERGDASRRMLSSDALTVGLSDVLTGRRTVNEVLRCGPRGIRMLAHAHPGAHALTVSQAARDRLASELRRLGERADAVVMDTVGGLTPWSERFWQLARHVIVVTMPDNDAIAATYAMLQVAHAANLLPAVRLVVNQCATLEVADDVHQRLGQAIYRHCGELLPALPALSPHEATLPSGRSGAQLARAVLAEISSDARYGGIAVHNAGRNQALMLNHGGSAAAARSTASGVLTESGEKIKL
jgi:MinD-like ATPase involved in chromosome partitioning or flagellar assembly